MALFTKTELEEVKLRLSGKKKNYKIWYLAKPKIKELLDVWFDKKEDLEKIIKK